MSTGPASNDNHETEYADFELLLKPGDDHAIGTFGQHLVLERIGIGATGLVYRAEKLIEPKRTVANGVNLSHLMCWWWLSIAVVALLS